MSTPLNPIPNKINDYLREFGNAVFSNDVPTPPNGSVNITWNQDQYGNVAAYVPSGGGGAVTPGNLPTQTTVNTTFAGATTPKQPGIVQSNVEPVVVAGVTPVRPSACNKTIVILGSSEAQGVGASTYGNSWAGLLGAGLTGAGYTIINSSITGYTTAQNITRFYTDVAPFRPDIVILATLTINEGYNITTWKNNQLQLAKMCRQIGAVPVILVPSADSNYTLQQFQNVEDVAKQLKVMGIPMLDALSATADPATGHYLTGLSGDGVHPNDAGHLAIYNSIPLTMFDELIYNKNFAELSNSNTRSWALVGTPVSQIATITPDRVLTSWTLAGWVNVPATPALTVYYSFGGAGEAAGNNMRLRQNVDLTLGFATATTNPAITTTALTAGWNHLALSYNSTLNLYTLYVNGVSAGTYTSVVTGTTITEFGLFNNLSNPIFAPTGASIGTTYLYRVPLFPQQVAELYKGFVHTSGLEWGSYFDTFASASVNVTATPPNVALTSNTLVTAAEVWASA